jgi:cytochrome c oxidase subunit 2
MHKQIVRGILLAALFAGGASAGDVDVACHGADGSGNSALNAPALAGQDAGYLARQIQNFQAGVRGADSRDVLGRQMQGMAATLGTPEAIADVAAYMASMPAPETATAEHDVRNGEVQYNAACGACHGPTAGGNPALNSPNLAILDNAYLRRQYQNFADGIRGAHPDDKYGRQMQMMATMLSTEKDLDDVIGFILAQ